tara:strand:+ start:117 stop:428 length:312 start_codon:yes stop_codon:yes gene_type:complete
MIMATKDNINKRDIAKIDELSPKELSIFEQLGSTVGLLFLLGGLFFVACSQIFGPSLCQCINEPGNKYYDKNVAHCQKLMKKEFGTKTPSARTMMYYINNNCK